MAFSISKYLGALEISAKSQIYYVQDLIITAVWNIPYAVLMVIVWGAIFASAGSAAIGGFTLSAFYVYYFASSTASLLRTQASWDIEDDVHQGNIVRSMVRPMPYTFERLSDSMVYRFTAFSFIGLPIMAAVILLTHTPVTFVSVGGFFVEVSIAFFIAFFLEVMIGISALYFVNVGGIRDVQSSLYYLSGGLIPLTFLPGVLQNIFQALPFQYISYVPAMTILGVITGPSLLTTIFTEILWAALLCCIAYLYWMLSRNRLRTVGV